MIQYSYLIGCVTLLIFWFILFFWRKDVRKEMMVMSLLFGCIGIISSFIYTVDWWHPSTITNTRVGIEDFLFGFVVGGIASVIYEEVFKKRIKLRKINKIKRLHQNEKSLFMLLFSGLTFFVGFYLLKMHSFHSSILALVIPIIYFWLKRKDLIFDSLASGFLLMIVSFLAFIIPEFITPGWVQFAWYHENLSGIIVLKAPLEDVVWFFLTGAFIGPLYEFWRDGKLLNKK
jgi:hypothetical protein